MIRSQSNDDENVSLCKFFNTKRPNRVVPANPHSAVFWVRYRGSLGDTLSPMPIALSMTITNTRQVPLTLDKISIAVRENRSQWLTLKHIPTGGQRVYWIHGDPKDSALLDFSTNGLDQLLKDTSIAPNKPVHGWIFFEQPNDFNGSAGTLIQWRFRAEIQRTMNMSR
jgi:hypothetical protein